MSSRRRTGYAAAALLALGTAVTLGAPTNPASAAGSTKDDGLVCATAGGSATAPTFSLDATSGYISTPDGNSILMWGYTAGGGSFQLPGPTLCVDSGATVTVTLHNTLREPVSITFPGQDAVTQKPLGGTASPAGPELDAAGNLTSLVKPAPAAGGTITYSFTAGSPGTYLYSSGTDIAKQREMGLYGALVVRPAGKPHQANDKAFSTFSREFVMLVSSVDPDWHTAVAKKKAYNPVSSTARYFLINGRSMPDTLAPNGAAWLPSQPYSGLVHITADPVGGATHAPALIRYLNAGSTSYPFHPHGSSQTVVTRDGAALVDPSDNPDTYGKFLLDVGPGQSIDALESWKVEYDVAGNPVPADVQLPQLQDQIVGPGTETWFAETPYLGDTSQLKNIPNGMVQNNTCGEYYHVAHSHALYQATNYGASFGGMMTLIRIDPPGHWNCGGSDYTTDTAP